jgi:hypothetical protein
VQVSSVRSRDVDKVFGVFISVAPGAYNASPVAAGSKLFLASAEGVVTVAGDGDTLTILSNNDHGEPIFGNASAGGIGGVYSLGASLVGLREALG